MNKAGLLGTVAAALALIAGASSAQAATTIGLSPPPPSPDGTPPSNCAAPFPADVVQVSTAPGINYEVPSAGGVITSWSTTTVGTGQMRLRLFSPDSNASVITPVAESDWLELGQQPPPATPTRISVAGGEKLGFSINSSSATDCLNISDNPANQGAVAGSAPLGQSTATITSQGQVLPGLVSVSAVVEPDADKDGYGDESQDRCPGVTDVPDGTCFALELAKPKANAKKGTATIVATVPSAGVATLKGRNVAVQTKSVSAAGTVKLTVKPKGRVKRKLSIGGKASVAVTVAFAPDTGGPIEQTTKVKLKKTKRN